MPDIDWVHDNVDCDDGSTLIFDDIASHLSSSTVEIFNVLSHHYGCNVIITVHNLFDRSPGFRDISLNSKYLVIFKV